MRYQLRYIRLLAGASGADRLAGQNFRDKAGPKANRLVAGVSRG